MFEQFEFADLQPWVHLLWLAPGVVLLAWWTGARRRHLLRVFGVDEVRSASWLAALRGRRLRRSVLLALALALGTTAAMRPRCNPEKQTIRTAARDIAILLDVSRSMLAADLQPSRLERAKDELLGLADRVEGDRVGLIAFAGNAVIKCPLTRNYSYFKSVVRNLTTSSASEGGTHIGDAIRKALDDLIAVEDEPLIESEDEDEPTLGQTVVASEMRGEKRTFADILIITDGEDHESRPLLAARRAARLGIGIYTVGLGSEEGSTISIAGEGGRMKLLEDRDGNVVRTRLDSRTLLDMTNAAPRGAYLPVGTQNFDLADFYARTIAQDSRRELEETQVYWTEIFQPFLLAALALYAIRVLVAERPRRGQLATMEASAP